MDGQPLTTAQPRARNRGAEHEQSSDSRTGIDLRKNSCSVGGLDASGVVVLRRRVTREGVLAFNAKLANCIVAIAYCDSEL
jgi:hypothetical protein